MVRGVSHFNYAGFHCVGEMPEMTATSRADSVSLVSYPVGHRPQRSTYQPTPFPWKLMAGGNEVSREDGCCPIM